MVVPFSVSLLIYWFVDHVSSKWFSNSFSTTVHFRIGQGEITTRLVLSPIWVLYQSIHSFTRKFLKPGFLILKCLGATKRTITIFEDNDSNSLHMTAMFQISISSYICIVSDLISVFRGQSCQLQVQFHVKHFLINCPYWIVYVHTTLANKFSGLFACTLFEWSATDLS